MYEDQTYEEIMERVLDNAREDIDDTEGGIFYSALAPAALEFADVYSELNEIVKQSFADTCDREHLVLRCKERGLAPYPATFAVLKGKFDADIGLDQRFNLDELNYISVEYIGSATEENEDEEEITYYYYKMECETPGTEGNTQFGEIEPIDYIDGLEYAELTELLVPGEDEEDTEDLRDRYYNSFESTPFGGNKKDYMDRTNAITGVGATKVIPSWNGGGTVKLIILASDYSKASTALINTVQTAIDPIGDQGKGSGIAPIGHTVTVVTVREVNITITASFVYSEGYNWNRLSSEITGVVEAYLLEIREDWANQSSPVVRIAQIESRILQLTGIVDISNTKINGSTNNLTLESDQIPVLSSVGEVS